MDDGIGMPEEIDITTTDSLGLHLVAILVEEQLHGEIKLDRSRGTKFQIRFSAQK